MKKIPKKVHIKSEFVRNSLTLSLGTTISQAFPMLLYPVLGRIYTPAEFGLLATLTSIIAILIVLSTGKYENGILIADTKQDAANIIGLVLIMSFSILLISFIVLQLFANQFSLWFNEPQLKKWFFVCPLTAFAIIIFNCYNEWCVRNKYFTSLSWNKITNSSSVTLSKVLFGFVKIFSNGLVVGDLIGRSISAFGCIVRVLRKDRFSFIQISFNRIMYLAKHYIEFPKFTLPGQLIDTLNTQLPILMITYFFMSEEVGYYSMAMAVLSVPAGVISVAIRDVFRQRANEEWVSKGNCKNIYIKTVKMMVMIITPVSILLIFILPWLFSFVLGKTWQMSGIYARILMPNVGILFVFQVVAAIFIIADKMKELFIWEIYSIILTIISLFIGCLVFKDIKITLISYVIARSIANLTRFYLTYQYSKGIVKNENTWHENKANELKL
ncbi:MAG: oligosaccharide flippase family protein [Bacteroidales bacterium]|nr:oligosaccharide flippase family protein [Bacteroidales bacterium]